MCCHRRNRAGQMARPAIRTTLSSLRSPTSAWRKPTRTSVTSISSLYPSTMHLATCAHRQAKENAAVVVSALPPRSLLLLLQLLLLLLLLPWRACHSAAEAPACALDCRHQVPLLVRIQSMNQCHAYNGAAAMALVRHAARRQLRWAIDGEPVSVGWRWGNCPEGAASLTVTQVGTQRVKHQAHAHQVVTFADGGGGEHLLDLSVAQFGSEASLRCVPYERASRQLRRTAQGHRDQEL